jgi:hypothetical protein
MISIVPTTRRNRFILVTVINLPAFVKGNTQIAQLIVAPNAINMPIEVISSFFAPYIFAVIFTATALKHKVV